MDAEDTVRQWRARRTQPAPSPEPRRGPSIRGGAGSAAGAEARKFGVAADNGRAEYPGDGGPQSAEQRTTDRYRIRGYLSTAAKHGYNMMDALRDAIPGRPWIPPDPAPA